MGAVQRDMVCKSVLVCAHGLGVRSAPWTPGWHARARPSGTPEVYLVLKDR